MLPQFLYIVSRLASKEWTFNEPVRLTEEEFNLYKRGLDKEELAQVAQHAEVGFWSDCKPQILMTVISFTGAALAGTSAKIFDEAGNLSLSISDWLFVIFLLSGIVCLVAVGFSLFLRRWYKRDRDNYYKQMAQKISHVKTYQEYLNLKPDQLVAEEPMDDIVAYYTKNAGK